MFCQEFWILNYTWLTWREVEEEFGGLEQAEKKHVVSLSTCQLSWRLWDIEALDKEKTINAKYTDPLRRVKMKCRLSVLRDFISCTCHSLPSRALQKCENSPCWSRSVNSLTSADVGCVIIRIHLHIRLLPWDVYHRERFDSVEYEFSSFYCVRKYKF